ncbi:MAG: DUF5916 domain-containing protein [Vicinamibacterales bacterium]
MKQIPAVASLLAFALVFLPSAAVPAVAAQPVSAFKATSPPVIDGSLSDTLWSEAPSMTGFKTWRPDFGQLVPDADQTVVWFAYDAENLYFAFRALDGDPAKIKASVARRDTIMSDDWVCINLDSFGDKQSLYAFYINPRGIQADSRYAAGTEDQGFDIVWYSAGTIDDKGYTVEVRIPFKSIRYGGGDPVRMAVVFERSVSRRSEGSTLPALDPRSGASAAAFLLQAAQVTLAGIRHYTLFEVLPDTTYNRRSERAGSGLARTANAADLGLSAKYGLTSQLTLDGTLNPDFSQVEADAGQVDVNLRHALFYPEKRPFFQEGQDFFNLGASNAALQSALNTRSIVNPIGGVKLSGKVTPSDSIGMIYSADELPGGPGPDLAHFTVLRYKRALREDAYLGGFYTSRESGPESNRVFGTDGLLRIDRASTLAFHAFGSTTSGGENAYSNGRAASVQYSRTTRELFVEAQVIDVSTGFDTLAGYLTRNGVTSLRGAFGPSFYPGSSLVRRIQPTVSTTRTRDAYSGSWEGSNEFRLRLVFPRSGSATFQYSHASEIFLGREFSTSGFLASASVQWTSQIRLQATATRGNAIFYSATPFQGRSARASLSLVYQPSERWNETFSLTYTNFDRDEDGRRLYDYGIARSRTSYQANRYLLFRAIVEYNTYRRRLLTDLLASFTYIPGTVLHAGYGSIHERLEDYPGEPARGRSFREMQRGFFLKASYLWRL